MNEWSLMLNFLMYLGVIIPVMIGGYVVFMIITPYKEHELIREGAETEDSVKRNAAKAAAHDLGGKVLGLSIVISSAIFHSVNLVDLLIWSVIGILSQVLVFYLLEILAPFSIIDQIPKGNVSVAIFASRLSIATGLLIAAAISF